MGLVETEALILKSYSLAEADKIVVFLSEHQGLVRGVAKGAKRLKSKFGGTLEPFTIAQMTYFQKEERELVSISQIELTRSFFDNAADPDFFQKFAYAAELLTEFAPPHEPNENLYRMVKACLETAAHATGQLDKVIFYFEFWLLKLGGYLPDWRRCENCRREISNEEKTNLQANYQILCQNCSPAKGKLLILPEQREVFFAAQKNSPQKFAVFAQGKDVDVKQVSTILKRIIHGILGKTTVSEKVLVMAQDNQ